MTPEKRKISNKQIDRLLKSNDDLYQFAYLAAHELQAPLGTIEGYLSLLKSEYGQNLSSDALSFLDESLSGAERMRSLIHALLKLSRVESQDLSYEMTDSRIALVNALKNLKSTIDEKNANIEFGILPTLKANEDLLMIVFQNLIGNAMKFSERTPNIKVDAIKISNGWQFSIEDNGIGFDMKHVNSLFHRFQRLHSQENYKGTGLGLALCKRIIDRHKGEIWVESVKGKGTVFYFTIPDIDS